METLFSDHNCRSLKDYSTQYCLLAMLKKCKSAVNNEKLFWVFLKNIIKAFYCFSQELPLVKVHA